MKKLIDILPGEVSRLEGDPNTMVHQLVFDSRQVTSGSAFFAIPGIQVDGHDYIEQALANGAKVVFCERTIDTARAVTWVIVPNASKAMGEVANKFFDNPSQHLKVIGVTGTNGKTTTVSLLHQLFCLLGAKAGLLSTVVNKIGATELKSKYTTPDAVSIHGLLRLMVEEGCEYVFMEVSSHAVVQHRIAGIHFSGGVFTNMSHDHLDYHGTFQAYIEAKKKFFDDLPEDSFALVNLDDKRGTVMIQNTAARKLGYSLNKLTDYKGKVLSNDLIGLQMTINQVEFFSRLLGRFNAYNLLAVYGVADQLIHEREQVITALSRLKAAPGRLERIDLIKKGAIAFIDYAHTPDALEKVLDTISNSKNPKSNLICIVGCGGNRDKTKRPIMGKVVSTLSNYAILTSDNPRDEDPETILSEMEKGVEPTRRTTTLRITDRKQAIKMGYALCKENDVLLIAGKGHETYQEIKGVRHPFDDKQVLQEVIDQDI